MLLDEPTNHLDVDAREALVEALNMYNGAIILVSHDPHLIRLVADRLWIIDQGACLPYDDDLDAYERSLLDARKGRRGRQSSDRSAVKIRKRAEAATVPPVRTGPLRKKSKEAEKQSTTCHARLPTSKRDWPIRIFMPVEKTLPACKKLWEARKKNEQT